MRSQPWPRARGIPWVLRLLVVLACVTASVGLALDPVGGEPQEPAGETQEPIVATEPTPSPEKAMGFIFTAPKRLLTESNETMCLSLHNIHGSGLVSLELLSKDPEENIASAQHKIKGKSICMELYVPQTSKTVGILQLKAHFDGYEYAINSRKEVYFDHNPNVVFIETDKPIYKPGQEVKFRIMTVNYDLLPVSGIIMKVWLENPSGVRMAQWRDVPTELGLAQLKFQLSPEPILGSWVIKVQRTKDHGVEEKSFEVKEYVLPKFKVLIRPPSFILADAEKITWAICAKYSYGKPVKGEMSANITSVLHPWRTVQPPKTAFGKSELRKDDGCTDFTLTGKELGLLNWDFNPASILINASVKEYGTDVVQSSTVTTEVSKQVLKLEFLPHSLKYFKSGLPYKGKMKVLHPNGMSASGEKIQICLKVFQRHFKRLVDCKTFTSNSNGFIEFVVPPQNQNVTLLSFTATALEYPTKYDSPNQRWRVFVYQPSEVFDVGSWYSPSSSYIEIADWDSEPLECNSRHLMNAYFTVDANVTEMEFHYLVKSRGNIVQSGHIVHHPNNRYIQELSEFPNLLGEAMPETEKTAEDSEVKGRDIQGSGDPVIDESLDMNENQEKIKIMDKLSFKLHVSPKMSPISDLLVYYVRDDGETVATSHTMKIEKCFSNKVNSKWLDSSLYPGSQTKFKVEATPESLCAITAVDKSVTFMGTGNSVDISSIFKQIERFRIDAQSLPRQADDWTYCQNKKKKDDDPEPFLPHLYYRHFSQDVDAIKAFDDAGLLVISDAKLHTRPCVYSNIHIPNGCNPCPFRLGARHFEEGMMVRGRSSPRRNRLKSARNHIVLAMSIDSPGEEVLEDRLESIAFDSAPILREKTTAYAPSAARAPVVEVRSYFPETWLWDLVHINESGIAELEQTTPHTITEWIGHATCLSPKTGLGKSLPANLNVFQPFFVEATMPYSVKRGELLRLKVSVFNFLSHSLPVRVAVSESSGMEIIGNNTHTYCIEDKGTVVPEFSLKMIELGEINVTVSAEVDEMYPEACGPEMLISRRDVMIKPIVVKPEGFPVEKTQSSFVCASESEDVILYWNLELPSDLVEGSARAEFSAVGDMLGPSLENLDSLVQLPVGCGEQNMVLLVPNIHVLDYLESTEQINPELRARAITNMEKGYQRQLNYRHEDGSYSAFGKYDPEGSMWLTAFVIKSFAQAKKFIFIDSKDLKISVRWITKRQMENGCFPFVGKVFHKDLKGGLSGETSSVAFTAYILTALLETGVEMAPSVLSNALYCLKAEDQEPSQTSDMYTLALTTYALTLTNETERAQQSLDNLLEMATREKDLLWWNKPGSKSLGMNIEITAYAILSLVKIGGEDNLIHAFQAVRWISQQRNSHGGFVSTQDTVVALEALTKYATVFMNNGNDKNANLSINMKTVDYDKTYVINDEVRLLLHHNEIPTLPTGVDVKASGKGCALVQTSLKYNVKTPKGSDAFDLSIETSPSMDTCSVKNLKICSRYKLTDEKSNMAIMEIDMISGYVPMKDSLEKLKLNPLLNLKRWEVDKNQVNLYFDELSSTRICVNFLVQQEAKIENPKPATVTVYDYYQQELFVSMDYNFPEDCVTEVLPEPLPIDPILRVDDSVPVDAEPIPLNLQEMKTSTIVVEGNSGVLRVNSSNIPVGLNPAFVNVDHDLEFPDGVEGPSPVYTSPQADSSRHHQERDECPLCLDSVPDNFAKIYCSSRNAYKVSVRKFLNAKILMALSPGRRTRKLNKQIMFDVKRTCSCFHIHKAGSHILVLNLDDRGFNDEKPHVRLGSSAMVIPIPQSPGQPSTVRSARSNCK